METLMISRCQIQSLPSRNSWDHRSCMKHGGSSFGDGFSITDPNRKIMGANPVSLCSQASFKAPLFIENSPGRGNSSAHLVKATSSPDKRGEGDQTKTGASILGGFGVFGYLLKVVLDVLTKKKEEYEDIGKKIEKAADVVDKVAETLEKAAKSTEEIAESVEGESPKDGKIYKAAEMVDRISETLSKDAQIVENQAEKVEVTIKAIDEAVEKSDDAVDSIVGEISSAVIAAENSSTQTGKTKNM